MSVATQLIQTQLAPPPLLPLLPPPPPPPPPPPSTPSVVPPSAVPSVLSQPTPQPAAIGGSNEWIAVRTRKLKSARPSVTYANDKRRPPDKDASTMDHPNLFIRRRRRRRGAPPPSHFPPSLPSVTSTVTKGIEKGGISANERTRVHSRSRPSSASIGGATITTSTANASQLTGAGTASPSLRRTHLQPIQFNPSRPLRLFVSSATASSKNAFETIHQDSLVYRKNQRSFQDSHEGSWRRETSHSPSGSRTASSTLRDNKSTAATSAPPPPHGLFRSFHKPSQRASTTDSHKSSGSGQNDMHHTSQQDKQVPRHPHVLARYRVSFASAPSSDDDHDRSFSLSSSTSSLSKSRSLLVIPTTAAASATTLNDTVASSSVQSPPEKDGLSHSRWTLTRFERTELERKFLQRLGTEHRSNWSDSTVLWLALEEAYYYYIDTGIEESSSVAAISPTVNNPNASQDLSTKRMALLKHEVRPSTNTFPFLTFVSQLLSISIRQLMIPHRNFLTFKKVNIPVAGCALMVCATGTLTDLPMTDDGASSTTTDSSANITSANIMINQWFVLMQFPIKGKRWCFPKGKCNLDETLVECATREVKQEVGYSLFKDKLASSPYIDIDRKQVDASPVRLFFVCLPPEDFDFKFQANCQGEVEQIAWIPLSTLFPAGKLSAVALAVWPSLLDYVRQLPTSSPSPISSDNKTSTGISSAISSTTTASVTTVSNVAANSAHTVSKNTSNNNIHNAATNVSTDPSTITTTAMSTSESGKVAAENEAPSSSPEQTVASLSDTNFAQEQELIQHMQWMPRHFPDAVTGTSSTTSSSSTTTKTNSNHSQSRTTARHKQRKARNRRLSKASASGGENSHIK